MASPPPEAPASVSRRQRTRRCPHGRHSRIASARSCGSRCSCTRFWAACSRPYPQHCPTLYFHRFTVLSVLTGLFVGFLRDFVIFLQASTLFVLIKMLFQPLSLQRRLASTSAATTSTSTSRPQVSTAMAALAQERYPRQVHLPVYFPVRTNDFELHAASTASTASSLSETDILDLAPTSAASVGTGTGGVGNNSSLPFNATHLTLVASSNSAATTFPLRYPLSGFMREGAMMGLKQLPGN